MTIVISSREFQPGLVEPSCCSRKHYLLRTLQNHENKFCFLYYVVKHVMDIEGAEGRPRLTYHNCAGKKGKLKQEMTGELLPLLVT